LVAVFYNAGAETVPVASELRNAEKMPSLFGLVWFLFKDFQYKSKVVNTKVLRTRLFALSHK